MRILKNSLAECRNRWILPDICLALLIQRLHFSESEFKLDMSKVQIFQEKHKA